VAQELSRKPFALGAAGACRTGIRLIARKKLLKPLDHKRAPPGSDCYGEAIFLIARHHRPWQFQNQPSARGAPLVPYARHLNLQSAPPFPPAKDPLQTGAGPDDLSSVIELTATKVVEQLQCQSMTLYLVEGEQIAFKQIYYPPPCGEPTRPKNLHFKQAAGKAAPAATPQRTENVGKVIDTGLPLFFQQQGSGGSSLKKMNTGFECTRCSPCP